MFHVLTISYLRPLDVVERSRPAHVDWVRAGIDAGDLLLAGRLDDGAGGVLITADIGVDRADALVATDPYVLEGVARYDRTSFTATLRGPGL